jgi:hypothetical protein
MNLHTPANAVPPLDPELAGLIDDLAGIDPAIDLLRDAARLIALSRHSVDKTQLLTVTLAGSPDGTDVLTLIGLLVTRLTNADSNPALRTLSLDRQKDTQLHGELLVHHLADPDLHQHASNASGAIHTD